MYINKELQFCLSNIRAAWERRGGGMLLTWRTGGPLGVSQGHCC